jgi:hypothetical protein
MEIAKKAYPKTTEKPVFEKLDPIPTSSPKLQIY